MMNKFDGYIEIASANDSDPLPKKWALGKWKAIPSNEHISEQGLHRFLNILFKMAWK